jgi:hypothetical protein
VDGYEWDAAKEASNLRKHGVRFADAVTALEDEQALVVEDAHPDEVRYVTLGLDAYARLLVVVTTYSGDNVRLISARLAEPEERRQYLENL